jgi:alanine-glyoxylate transaminase/serine-glyoxylate transaminase/serine-pyruvate transaminase
MIKSFHPPLRTLMGPGPSDVSPRVLAAMARPTIGHLDPAFIGMMDEIKQLLQYALRTENALTMPVSAPGSAGMEACFVNLVEPGDKVIVCQNGVFGGSSMMTSSCWLSCMPKPQRVFARMRKLFAVWRRTMVV